MSVDKNAIRRDYEAGMSLRALALKYGCSKSAVNKWAKCENWQRGQMDTLADSSTDEQDRKRFVRICLTLLDKISEAMHTPEKLNARDIRALSAALLDMRQILNAVSAVEAEAQRLRIEGLRRQLETAGGGDITVRFVNTDDAEE